MEVLGLLIFVSLMLVVGSVLLFAWSAKQRDHEHADRLALLPFENDPVDLAPGAVPPRAETPENGFETR